MISDADFDSELDRIVEVIRVALENGQPSDFVTTVYLLHGHELTIQLLVSAESPTVDTYDLLHQFGSQQRKVRPCPDAVFVAAAAAEDGGAEAIVLVGCMADGRANAAEIGVERKAHRLVGTAGVSRTHVKDGARLEWRRNGALEVLRGFQAAPTTEMRASDDLETRSAIRLASWLLLAGFLFISSTARALYSAQDAIPSSRFELLSSLGALTFLWYWFMQQIRPHRVGLPLDMGLFIWALWFVLAPYYLWRFERWRGLAKCLLLAAIFVGAQVWSIALHYGLVAIDGNIGVE